MAKILISITAANYASKKPFTNLGLCSVLCSALYAMTGAPPCCQNSVRRKQIKNGWRTRIRTWTDGSKIRCPALRRSSSLFLFLMHAYTCVKVIFTGCICWDSCHDSPIGAAPCKKAVDWADILLYLYRKPNLQIHPWKGALNALRFGR